MFLPCKALPSDKLTDFVQNAYDQTIDCQNLTDGQRARSILSDVPSIYNEIRKFCNSKSLHLGGEWNVCDFVKPGLYMVKGLSDHSYDVVGHIIYHSSSLAMPGFILDTEKDIRIPPFNTGDPIVVEEPFREEDGKLIITGENETLALTGATGVIFPHYPIFRLWFRDGVVYLSSTTRLQVLGKVLLDEYRAEDFIASQGLEQILKPEFFEGRENHVYYLQFIDPRFLPYLTLINTTRIVLIGVLDQQGKYLDPGVIPFQTLHWNNELSILNAPLADLLNPFVPNTPVLIHSETHNPILVIPKSYEWRRILVGSTTQSMKSYVAHRYFEIVQARFNSPEDLAKIFPFDRQGRDTLDFLAWIFNSCLALCYRVDEKEYHNRYWGERGAFRSLSHYAEDINFMKILNMGLKKKSNDLRFYLESEKKSNPKSQMYSLFRNVENDRRFSPEFLYSVSSSYFKALRLISKKT